MVDLRGAKIDFKGASSLMMFTVFMIIVIALKFSDEPDEIAMLILGLLGVFVVSGAIKLNVELMMVIVALVVIMVYYDKIKLLMAEKFNIRLPNISIPTLSFFGKSPEMVKEAKQIFYDKYARPGEVYILGNKIVEAKMDAVEPSFRDRKWYQGLFDKRFYLKIYPEVLRAKKGLIVLSPKQEVSAWWSGMAYVPIETSKGTITLIMKAQLVEGKHSTMTHVKEA